MQQRRSSTLMLFWKKSRKPPLFHPLTAKSKKKITLCHASLFALETFCFCPHLFTRLFFSFLCLGRKQMGHGTTDAAAFGGKSVALNALSQDEYQELTSMSIASFQIIKTLIIIIIIIIIMIIVKFFHSAAI